MPMPRRISFAALFMQKGKEMKKKKMSFYACSLPDGRTGIAQSWDECLILINNVKGAKYKKFVNYDQAKFWLDNGADYKAKFFHDKDGVYFDSGTGGDGKVKVRVTDKNGEDLVKDIFVKDNATNNFGELIACKYALKYALETGIKKVFGDSRLVIKFWSRGRANILNSDTLVLIEEVKALREEFERNGGEIELISGDVNPADLGFHRK